MKHPPSSPGELLPKTPKADFKDVLLQVRGLACSQGDKRLFQGLDFCLRRGEWTAILGGNGVGKSTLLMALVGLKKADQGAIEISGTPLHLWNRRALAKEIGLLQQSPEGGLEMTVRSNALLGRAPWQDAFGTVTPQDATAVDKALDEAHVAHLANRRLQNLSGGEKRRAFLAQALAQETKVLLLDEPTAFLDLKQQCLVLDVMRQQAAKGLAVASVLHDPNHALDAHQVLLMFQDGSVQVGPPEAILTSDKLSALYGTQISSVKNSSGAQVFIPQGIRATPL